MTCARSLIVCLLTISTATALSVELSADEVPRYTIHRTTAQIKIDGRLEESAWRDVVPVGDFRFPWWKAGEKEQTAARMLWDDNCLYVAFRCEDAHIWAKHKKRDSQVYKDDCVEVFTAPNPKRPSDYFNIEMNVTGAILDRHHPDGPGKPETPNWNAKGVRIASTIDGTLNDDSDADRSWVLEVAIPFSNFAPVTGRPHPRDGDVWHLNLNRLGGRTNPQHSQWSPGRTEKPAFHTPSTFGRVTFSINPQTVDRNRIPAGYEPVANQLSIPDDVKLGRCSAVAIDSQGALYLFHRGQRPILKFDRSGRFVDSWGNDLIGMAHGLRVDGEDNVWATDIGHHMVFKFSPTGKLLLALGKVDRPGMGRDQFNKPTDVAFGPNGEVFVSDGYGNSRVVKFDRMGRYLTEWGKAGDAPGEFNLPHSIIVDSQNRVLVGDRENDRIQIFDLNGRRLDIWKGFAPYGITIDAHRRIFIADGRANQILRLNKEGRVDLRIGAKGSAPGQFNLPHMLAVDSNGNLLVAEVGGERLQKLAPKLGGRRR